MDLYGTRIVLGLALLRPSIFRFACLAHVESSLCPAAMGYGVLNNRTLNGNQQEVVCRKHIQVATMNTYNGWLPADFASSTLKKANTRMQLWICKCWLKRWLTQLAQVVLVFLVRTFAITNWPFGWFRSHQSGIDQKRFPFVQRVTAAKICTWIRKNPLLRLRSLFA